MVYIVGIGPGEENLLSNKSIDIIKKADIVIGGDRQLEILQKLNISPKSTLSLSEGLKKAVDTIDNNPRANIVVLASGDPTLYGIADYIKKNIDENKIEIIPAISSISYAFSRFKQNMNDVYITSSHGRKPDFDFIFLHKKIAMVTDEKIGPYEIYLESIKRKKRYRYFIGENLSYEEEKLYVYDMEVKKKNYGLCVLIMIELEEI